MKWFQKTPDEVLQQLDSHREEGLSPEHITERQQTFGSNSLTQAESISPFRLFLKQLKNPLLVVLAFGALLSFYTGHTVDAIAITIIILINALITFFQELKAQKSIDASKIWPHPSAWFAASENGKRFRRQIGTRRPHQATNRRHRSRRRPFNRGHPFGGRRSPLTGESDLIHKKPKP